MKEVCVRGDTHEKIVLGTYQNVMVDREWYEAFSFQYSYADKVVNRLSLYKEAHGIENVKDEPYLIEFAEQDASKYIQRLPTYGDADEAFERAIARSYAEDDEE